MKINIIVEIRGVMIVQIHDLISLLTLKSWFDY